ncbi:FeS assembly SUF system protein [Malaciobacter molluscorum LMG 25693]|uniref:FeS assembly SUF system protein n=1 Tax=Malaciobacter molluscorum LMG 25693 TaxID=870501 RepID=A0A2G1DFY3_9BACT|nr:metal-sulfur cluster assembly factor [Malaciobacter molluscorum]AXX91711.1 [Fe-S] cluster assembly protein [Malaciobacter molluscorum LMG 25693]PHO17401.1 FeS assembly SUF system protein [Malaciobacter molluscorum LMG 25693]
MSNFTKEQLKEIEEKIIFNLKQVYDPEIPVNVYDLGLIYKIDFEQKDPYLYVTITMTLTSPACPVADALIDQVKYVTQAVELVDEAYVHLVFDPVWNKEMISEEGKDLLMMNGTMI